MAVDFVNITAYPDKLYRSSATSTTYYTNESLTTLANGNYVMEGDVASGGTNAFVSQVSSYYYDSKTWYFYPIMTYREVKITKFVNGVINKTVTARPVIYYGTILGINSTTINTTIYDCSKSDTMPTTYHYYLGEEDYLNNYGSTTYGISVGTQASITPSGVFGGSVQNIGTRSKGRPISNSFTV